jgi:hypothetical protein
VSVTALVLALLVAAVADGAPPGAAAWRRHAVDDTSRGADGVRPADVNGDGRPDLCVGWEQGGVIRAYLHPDPQHVKRPWPAVTVGRVKSPEDAVFVDLDGDGATDVVSCCEGKQRTVFVHWAPAARDDYLKADAWQTETLPPSESAALWMFALPMPLGADGRFDVIAGSKGDGAAVGRFVAPDNPRNTHRWRWQPLCPAGWIMSLVAEDVDGDGDGDVIFSDRKGPRRGVHWLVNPGPQHAGDAWDVRPIGGAGKEVMFLDVADLDADGRNDVVVATRGGGILMLRRTDGKKPAWEESEIPLPPGTGTGKSVRVADVDRDGRADLVFSCENARKKHGVMWLSRVGNGPLADAKWQSHPVSGIEEGVKFDLLQLIDLDTDGDLDVLTCEESDNLGVIWYENPAR